MVLWNDFCICEHLTQTRRTEVICILYLLSQCNRPAMLWLEISLTSPASFGAFVVVNAEPQSAGLGLGEHLVGVRF